MSKANPPSRTGPLAGLTIVVTRARHQAQELIDGFEALGAEVIGFPTIEVQPVDIPASFGPLDRFDWAVFTSANAVAMFAKGLAAQGSGPVGLGNARICAVGPATARALKAQGLDAAVLPDTFVAESLVEALTREEQSLEGKRVLFPKGEIARDVVPNALRERGAQVTELVVYRTHRPEVPEAETAALVRAAPEWVVFSSSSTARNWVAILGRARLEALETTVKYASIGPQTTETAVEEGLTIAVEAERHDVPGLVAEVLRWVGEGRPT